MFKFMPEKMQKKFLSNLVLLLLVNLLVKPFWIFGVDRVVQNAVGNEQYGVYINLFTLSLLFTMVLDFGINNYTNSFIAKHPQLLNKKFEALFPLKLLFSLAYLVITITFAILYGIRGHALLVLGVLSANQVMAYFILYFRANISGLQLFRTDALLSITDRGLMIIFALLLFFVFKGEITIQQFIGAQSLGYLSSMLISFMVLKKPLKRIQIRFNLPMMVSMVKQSWPYALLTLLMITYTRTDYLLMKKLIPDGDIQNGIYALANRLMEAANMFAVLISGMLLPVFSSMIKKKETLQPITRMSIVLLIVPSIAVATICWHYNEDIMKLLSGSEAHASAEVLKWVMISFVALCVMYVFGTMLTANGSLKTLNILAFGAVLLSFTLNFLLIPKYGAVGAAISALITQSFIAITNMVFAIRYLKLPFDAVFVFKLLFIISVMLLSGFLFQYMQVGLFAAATLIFALCAILLVIMRLINFGQVGLLLSSRR